MEQTESLLLVGLGFAAAVLIAMVAGYSVWLAANRWAERKRRKSIPVLILDLQAEREALRAQNALTSRRFEVLLEKAKAELTERSAEVNRHRNRAMLHARKFQQMEAEIVTQQNLVTELTDETNRRAKVIARLTGRNVDKLRTVEGARNLSPAQKAAIAKQTKAGAKLKGKIAALHAVSDELLKEKSAAAPVPEPVPAPAFVPAPMAPREAISETASETTGVDVEVPVEAIAETVPPPLVPDDTPAEHVAEEPLGETAEREAFSFPAMEETPVPEQRLSLAEKFRMLKNGIDR